MRSASSGSSRMSAAGGWGAATELTDVSGEVDHSGASGRGAVEIGAQAVERALADAGIEPREVDGLLYRSGIGPQFDEHAFHRHFGTDHELFVSHEGGAMTWAATAPHVAAQAIRSGK